MLKNIKKPFIKWRNDMKKIFVQIAIIAIIISTLCACNAVRTITTTQTHIKGQDTVVTMTTRTTESYDANINLKK